MKLTSRTLRATLAAAAVTALAAGPAAAAGASAPARVLDLDLLSLDDAGLGRVVVAYEDGVVGAGLLDELVDLGIARGLELRSIDAVAVTATPAVLAEVLTDERVVDYHQQRRIALDLYASRTQINAEEADQPEEYEAAGEDGTFTATRPGVTGEGVTVGVLDSGIASVHPDLANTTVGLNFSFMLGFELVGATAEQIDQYAEATGTLALQDDIGHGTHVASTIGGTGALAAQTGGPDLSGVAPGVEFVSMKITTAPFGIVEDFDFEESALAAFDYLVRHPELGIDVTNNSWGLLPTEPNCLGLEECFGLGEPTDFDAVSELVDTVVDSGVDVVFSAGNSGPADEDGVGTIGDHVGTRSIVVAAACKAVDSACAEGQDTTDFSSRGDTDRSGPQVEVTAPGDQIMAALSPSVLAPLTECPDAQHPGYFCISGTSMSSPHVAGVAALLRELDPELTPAEVEACIVGTAVPLPNALGLSEAQLLQDAGAGMVDTEAALRCVHDPVPPTATAGDPDTAADAGDDAATGTDDELAGAPSGAADGAPTSGAAARAATLPNTGGGVALLAIPALAGAVAVRRRR